MADPFQLPPPVADINGFGTPLNLTLLAVLGLVVYLGMRPGRDDAASATVAAQAAQAASPPLTFKTFTPHTLRKCNGVKGAPLLVAVRGNVYDVGPGRSFYGPGAAYHVFAGRDASRGLATNSLDEDEKDDLDGPLDELKGLTDDQTEALNGWEERFRSKYLLVGKLVAAGSADADDADGKKDK